MGKDSDSGDENKERGNWGNKIDFFLSCLGYAVGLGNVWRFPYLCYRNGGGAFFIPYVIMLVIVGIPVFFLELSLGQYTSQGPLTCWRCVPFFKGIGLGMNIVSCLVGIYYNMIIAWAIYYLFASFTSKLPWEDCSGSFTTTWCYNRVIALPNITEQQCIDRQFKYDSVTGACMNGTDVAFRVNHTAIMKNVKLPSHEYLNREVLGAAFAENIEELGPIRWQILLCYLLAFILIFLCLSKGVKSSGKVVWFTATFPYLVLVILLIRGLFLDGYKKGIDFYITPELDRLADARVWKDAAVQIFFSLSASWGGLIALASYNKFHNNALCDTLLVSLGNCCTSVFAGFVIFSYIGFLANDMGIEVSEVADSGPTLAFVVYPFAVTKMPVSPLWAILFFIMLLTLGVDSEFVLVETVTTSIMDQFPKLRSKKTLVVGVYCLCLFVLGLTLTTNGGVNMLDLMDSYSGGWNVLLICIAECITIAYFYGITRFLADIECMLGSKVLFCLPWKVVRLWWAAMWMFLTPLGAAFILVFSWVDYKRFNDDWPEWTDALGWLMTMAVVVAIFLPGIYMIIRHVCIDGKAIGTLFRPAQDWGPALRDHRIEANTYNPLIIVDPPGADLKDIELKVDGQKGPPAYDNQGYVHSERL